MVLFTTNNFCLLCSLDHLKSKLVSYDCNKIDLIILFGIKQLIIIMEEDILNHLPTVMFRGTPCIYLDFETLCTLLGI